MTEKPASESTAAQLGGMKSDKLAVLDGTASGIKLAEKKSAGGQPFGEMAKDAPAKKEAGPGGGARLEEQQVTQSINGIADSKPATAASPKPSTPAPVAASQSEPPKADDPGSAAVPVPPPPAVAMSPAPIVPKLQELPDAANNNRWADKSVAGYGTTANSSAAKGNDQFANGYFALSGGNSPSAGPAAAAEIIVRLDVTSLAVENKVFEKLLAQDGLDGDQNFSDLVQNAPADTSHSIRRSGQLVQGSRENLQDLSQQQNLAGDPGGGMGRGVLPPARSGSASLGALNRQQSAAPASSPAVQDDPGAQKSERNNQASSAPASPRARIAAKAPAKQREADHRDDAKQSQPRATKSLVYQFDASPEQLAVIVKQLGEKSSSFSAAEIKPAVWVSQGANSLAGGTFSYLGNNHGGGGGLGVQQREEQKAKAAADAGAAKIAPEPAAQPQAPPAPAPAPAPAGTVQAPLPAAGAAKRHIVFVLNVVDRLPSDNGHASQLPAAAPPPSARP